MGGPPDVFRRARSRAVRTLTASSMVADNEETLEHFRVHGWMRVRTAFSVDEAAAVRAATWRALANVGIREGEPSTWTRERPEHLQHVKDDPVFRAVGSVRLLEAIDAALDGLAYQKPRNWGALFLAFPSNHPWTVPSRGWHADANYSSALFPPAGVRTHALFGDVRPAPVERSSFRARIAWFTRTSKTIYHRLAHAAPITAGFFKVIPIFVTCTSKAILRSESRVSSTAVRSTAASHYKSSRTRARQAT